MAAGDVSRGYADTWRICPKRIHFNANLLRRGVNEALRRSALVIEGAPATQKTPSFVPVAIAAPKTPGLPECKSASEGCSSPLSGRFARQVPAQGGCRSAAVIRIEKVWMAVEPPDMRAGSLSSAPLSSLVQAEPGELGVHDGQLDFGQLEAPDESLDDGG